LKAKRAAIRPIVDGLRHRFRISVAEVDHQDQWQRATIGVALVAESDGRVQELLDAVERFVVGAPDVDLLGTETAWLDPDGVLDPDCVLGDSAVNGEGGRLGGRTALT
jgi:uncharacterized protein YlxP (DUF503 family)